MNNEGLKPKNFEDKKLSESFLLEKISKLDKQNKELEEKVFKLTEKNEVLEQENEVLEQDLIHDHLTGLKTRKYFEERLEEIISSLKNTEQEKREEGYRNFSVIFCDLDNFKEVNDTLGHKEGDNVLKKVSEIISEKVRDTDIVSRWGGDEIAIGLLGADENEAVVKAEEIRIATEEGMKDMNVTASIGVAFYKEGLDADSIIRQGDEAMYLAKNSGKNRIKTYSEISKMSKKEE